MTTPPRAIGREGEWCVVGGGRAMRGFIEMPRRCSALNNGIVKCWIPKWAYCFSWIRADEQRMICCTSILNVSHGCRIIPNVRLNPLCL